MKYLRLLLPALAIIGFLYLAPQASATPTTQPGCPSYSGSQQPTQSSNYDCPEGGKVVNGVYRVSSNSPIGGCNGQGVKVSIGLTGPNQCTDPNTNPIYAYAKAILGLLGGLIGVVAAGGYVWAGYVWMTSTGQPDRLKKAKLRLVQVTVSLLLFIFMTAILRYLIPGIFG